MLASTELRELAKLGSFITHYYEHKEQNKELSLVNFIEIHYINSPIKDNDFDKDMKLPFKTHNCSSHAAPEITFFNTFNYYIQEPIFFFKASNNFYNNLSLPSSYLSDIWQPPRI